MQRLTSHRVLAILVLLAFLLSTNALSFGHHAAEEMLQALNQIAAVPTLPVFSAEGTQAVDTLHHGHPAAGHDENHDSNDCCDTLHSHDTADGPTGLIFMPLAFSILRFIEPFAWVPEVFLDRFIPPQNHA